MRLTHRSFAAVALVLLIVMAGCSGAGGGDATSFQGEPQAAELGMDAGDGARAKATPTAAAEPTVNDRNGELNIQTRARIQTGEVELEVTDFEAARRNLTVAVHRHGGFVSDARQFRHRVDNKTYVTGVVTFRVPQGNFSAFLEQVKTEGTVIRIEQNTKDVTDQLIDLEARLRNLRAQRKQLRALYDRANDTEDILKIQNRLSEVQGEIERLEARRTALTRRVALSTVTVELREPRPVPLEERRQWYDIGVLAAFLDSVSGVTVTVRALVVAFAYALPYLLVFGTPLVAVGMIVRRRRVGSRADRPDGHSTEEEEGGEDETDEEVSTDPDS